MARNDLEGTASDNPFDLPDGKEFLAEWRRWLDRIRRDVLGTVATIGVPAPAQLPPLADYTDPVARAMTPILGAYWDESGKQTMARLGLDPDEWKVTSPHLASKIERASFAFAESTLKTANAELVDALATLRQELLDGIVAQGDSVAELAKRVNGVFTALSKGRARTVAATEASRAHHAAAYEADVQSGVVAGVELLLSSDACPICRQVYEECRQVRLQQAFAVIGTHPEYSLVRHPPLHPNCQCSITEVLLPEYGGPAAPEWGTTVVQPGADAA